MGSESGQAYAFMAMTAVVPGLEDELEGVLNAFGDASPLARLGTTHFARFIVLRDTIYQGPPQTQDSLQSAYLVFTSNFDGGLEDYLASIHRLMADESQQIWGRCVGFPGTVDRDAFVAYLLHNQIETTFFFAAYNDLTVADVRADVGLREQLAAFAIAGQAMDAATLMQRWRTELGGTRG